MDQEISVNLLLLVLGTTDSTELSAGELDRALFLGWDSGLDEFDHFTLEGHESTDL